MFGDPKKFPTSKTSAFGHRQAGVFALVCAATRVAGVFLLHVAMLQHV